jgi:hypothetical protein
MGIESKHAYRFGFLKPEKHGLKKNYLTRSTKCGITTTWLPAKTPEKDW